MPSPDPPVAPRRPHVLSLHGDERADDWYWLRERDDPEVRSYLEAENEYTQELTARTRELQERLFDEFKHRVVETDESVPARRGGYWYLRRTVEGLEYAIHCRRQGGEAGPEQVLLDENALATGHDFLDIGALEVSPDARLLAYAFDTTGGERFVLRIRDLASGSDLDEISNVYYGVGWGNDSQSVLYTRPNDAMRPWQVWRHRLGTPAEDDVLVLQEDDERFYVRVARLRSDRLLVIVLESNTTTEVLVVDADDLESTPRLVVPRRHGVEATVEDAGDRLLVLTNVGSPDFRVVDEHGADVVPARDGVRVLGVEAFTGHLVVTERSDAIERITIDGRVVEQPEDVYAAAPDTNLEFETDVFRFKYASLVTPLSTVEVDFTTGERRVRKQQPVRDYDPAAYASERTWATAEDGERVPVSIVYRRDRPRDGGPLLLYGYGSYEATIQPVFSPLRLSLLDRGVAWAIAHVRGGGELGRRWYEAGKLEHKQNTFDDFIACAEHLVAEGWTSPQRMVARGASAGGLLMGVIANLRPDLFAGIVAEVPFVDAVTTMLDDTIPLTATEWEEWGDPRTEVFYAVLKAYSPYDNVEAKDYPAMLVTAGLNDPRVAYWEPAKWVAKLRATKTDSNPLLLKTQMGAGHGGPSGRYEGWREEAFVYAFVLDVLGLA
jgi:oligopeptidase B